MYIGGAEHSVLHLLYARFVTMVLHDRGLLDFEEPFTKFRAHGLLIKDGAKMSKSRGNVINPDEYIAKYGADTLRCYLMFLGPFDQGGDFRDSGIEGMERFLKKVRRLVEDNLASKNQSGKASDKDSSTPDLDSSAARAVKFIAEDLENLRYNTALAKFMTFINDLTASKANIQLQHLEILTLILAPFAPYLSEELWEALGKEGSVHAENWPIVDESKIMSESASVAVQINGKTRAVLEVSLGLEQSRLEVLAKENENVAKYLEGKKPKKVIHVKDKILNFVF
jgi:leucyl-tRNA synthetase